MRRWEVKLVDSHSQRSKKFWFKEAALKFAQKYMADYLLVRLTDNYARRIVILKDSPEYLPSDEIND